MGGDAGAEAADGVGADGFADEFAVAEAVEHGGVGAQVATPAHAHGGEDGNGVVGDVAVACRLLAYRAVVAVEVVATVGAGVLFRTDVWVMYRCLLPGAETGEQFLEVYR